MAINIVIFASGSGSNAENLVHFFANGAEIRVTAFFCNNPRAFVIERAKNLQVPCVVFNRPEFAIPSFLDRIEHYQADFIVLAGFLWKIPDYLISAFPDRIINIHPALLPKYGGKGMYGSFVHESVIANEDAESGITIHVVNEHYDAGRVLFQYAIPIKSGETAEGLAAKIHELEYQYFPKIVADYIREKS